MPDSLIIKNGELVGYSMEYIKKSSNILDVKIKDFINELDVIINDMELLNGLNVRLIDINKNSIVYNGRLYLIDLGNYYINYIDDLLVYLDYKNPNEKAKQDNNLISDITILQKYFDLELSVKESINKFVKEYIRVDEDEKKLIMFLYIK